MQQRIAVMAASVLGLAISAQALGATREASADALVNDFVYESLALAPATATFAGYHVHKGVRLDGLWDDYSLAGIAREHSFNVGLSHRRSRVPHSMPSAWPISISCGIPSA